MPSKLVMAESKKFRTTSTFFQGVPWRTEVLSAPGALQKLHSVPELSVSWSVPLFYTAIQLERSGKAYLCLICEQEKSLYESTYFPGVEKLRHLRSFCLTGNAPPNIIAKELLKYRVLDIIALVHGKASEISTKGKGSMPLIDKLVCLVLSAGRLSF